MQRVPNIISTLAETDVKEERRVGGPDWEERGCLLGRCMRFIFYPCLYLRHRWGVLYDYVENYFFLLM